MDDEIIDAAMEIEEKGVEKVVRTLDENINSSDSKEK